MWHQFPSLKSTQPRNDLLVNSLVKLSYSSTSFQILSGITKPYVWRSQKTRTYGMPTFATQSSKLKTCRWNVHAMLLNPTLQAFLQTPQGFMMPLLSCSPRSNQSWRWMLKFSQTYKSRISRTCGCGAQLCFRLYCWLQLELRSDLTFLIMHRQTKSLLAPKV